MNYIMVSREELDQQREVTRLISQAVREINSEPVYTARQKADLVKKLGGAPRQELFNFLNVTYRTGPDIAKNLEYLLRPGRPRGGPSSSPPGDTKESVLKRLKRMNRGRT